VTLSRIQLDQIGGRQAHHQSEDHWVRYTENRLVHSMAILLAPLTK
jgi:hypothetical protein